MHLIKQETGNSEENQENNNNNGSPTACTHELSSIVISSPQEDASESIY